MLFSTNKIKHFLLLDRTVIFRVSVIFFHKMAKIYTESGCALLNPEGRPVLELECHFDFQVISMLSFTSPILKVDRTRARFAAVVKLRTALRSQNHTCLLQLGDLPQTCNADTHHF